MADEFPITRRHLLAAAATAGLAVAAPAALRAEQCERTPSQGEGPFYMNTWRREAAPRHINDLTWVRSPDQRAEGDVIVVKGQVADLACRPLEGAMVEIWQACRTGRYNHASDSNPAWLDPNFRYFGEFITGPDGVYEFTTIKPGEYAAAPGWVRPAHIHFKAHAPGAGGLTTQMYFAGDPRLESEGLLRGVSRYLKRNLIIEPTRANGVENLYRFDLRLG